MAEDRQRPHEIEIILPGEHRGGAGHGRGFQDAGFSVPQKPLSPFLRGAILVAALAGGLGLLALLVAFAATVALVAVPAALVAAGAAWIGMRWRAWRAR